jgi:hypothetical protein
MLNVRAGVTGIKKMIIMMACWTGGVCCGHKEKAFKIEAAAKIMAACFETLFKQKKYPLCVPDNI